MAQLVKRIDQQRHELKALRYILEVFADRRAAVKPFPERADFQIPACQQIYDALAVAQTQADAIAAIRALDLEDTDVESFLHLGGKHYHIYPGLVAERGEQFRRHQLEIAD